jgi:hypothetical protein
MRLEHQRRLARAVRPDERDFLASGDAQVDAVERLESVGIGEVEMADVDPSSVEVDLGCRFDAVVRVVVGLRTRPVVSPSNPRACIAA